MKRISAKYQITSEIHEEKYSLSSLLLNHRTFLIILFLVSLWFLFDITHGFGMAPPYPSEWLVEKEPNIPVDYWAIVGGSATLISIFALRAICSFQRRLYEWAQSGTKYPHLKEYLAEGYWANMFKILRTNRTTALCLSLFLLVSLFVTVLWIIDPPFIGFLGAIGFFEANDLIVAIFFPFFILLFMIRPYSRLLANLRRGLQDYNSKAQILRHAPISQNGDQIRDLVFVNKNRPVNPLDPDRMLGLEPYRDYEYRIFALVSIFLIPDLFLAGLQLVIWGNMFFLSLFTILAFMHLIALIYTYIVAVSCCNEAKHSQRQINDLVRMLLDVSVKSKGRQTAVTLAQTYALLGVRIRLWVGAKATVLAIEIAIPLCAVVAQYWRQILGIIAGE